MWFAVVLVCVCVALPVFARVSRVCTNPTGRKETLKSDGAVHRGANRADNEQRQRQRQRTETDGMCVALFCRRTDRDSETAQRFERRRQRRRGTDGERATTAAESDAQRQKQTEGQPLAHTPRTVC